ncbi:energy transducer TonB [Mucilaginibacter celer]|uniref:TonB family protein n=1 Tax=Mucilaginibacter celer TaxID=2305508 RepID=A0A494VRF0_9SPHI|nr:energy transducer TonB [Mucilaginibacter celer]AYL98186.1 TonB family protein [Mucilaginibacter celer]
MKYNLFLIPVLACTKLFAQTTYINKIDKEQKIRQKISVLKADNNIWQGKYTEYNLKSNSILNEGYYKNNQKDSTWKYYNNWQKLAETGGYKADKRIGVWSAFDNKGELELQFDYDNDSLLFYKPTIQEIFKKQYNLIEGNDTTLVELDRKPIFLDGSSTMGSAIAATLRYPEEARSQHIEGKVIVAFKVNLDGTVSSFRVSKSLGYGCDEEALKAIKNIKGKWLPAVYQDREVVVENELPISFTLSY